MLTAIVYGSIFLMVLGALTGYVLTQNKVQSTETAATRATAIAEAGLEYYRWFLAHYPNDLQNGTGQSGPYLIPYNDPEGGETGTIELSVTGNSSCGTITSIDIESKGMPAENPSVSRTVTARYARPSVARYSYVLNDTVWAGPDRVINGPYHSNGGIRMDGASNSTVSSSLSSWLCTSNFGCYPNQTKAGVFGAGSGSAYWSYPVPQVDFAGITANLSQLKTKAQANGRYLLRFSSGNNTNNQSYWRGYHLIFNANGTVTARRVSGTTQVNVEAPVNSTEGYNTERTIISSETFYSTITFPSDCALLFVEDNTWIEGVIDGKITLVVANVTNTGIDPNVILLGNLTYEATDGTDGLTVIGEKDILIAPNSPQNMTLNGIFVAQGGAFGRNRYVCPSSYEPRGTLTILGTTVSNLRTGTQWNGGCPGGAEAGYQVRYDNFHRKLSNDPPPFTPITSSDFEFVEWREN